MPSFIPGYEYDTFFSYRQNDNKTSPAYDQIKKKYSPFSKALSELMMPMKLELEKFVKL